MKTSERMHLTSDSNFDAAPILAQAIAHHHAGMLAEAENLYQRILEHCPNNFDCLHLLGVLHSQREDYVEAMRLFNAALKVDPAVGDAYSNRGNALAKLRRFEEALKNYDKAVALNPTQAVIFNNRGSVLRDLGRLEEAVASYDRAIALRPDFAEAFSNRGNALNRLERFSEALADYDRAIALKPNYFEAFCNRGVVLHNLARYQQALSCYDHALTLKPDHAETLRNCGAALLLLRRPQDAIERFARAIALKPDLDFVLGSYVHTKMQLCDWSDFEAECSRLLGAVRSGAAACHPFYLLACRSQPQDQLLCARTSAGRQSAVASSLWRGERYRHHRIRVAYLSSDFYDHPIARLMAGVFEHHDHERFETFAISFGPDRQDALRARLKAGFDRFVDAHAMGGEDVSRFLRAQEIDIAVDLNGFTEGARPNVFARKPTPLQVNYLGYSGTLGRTDCDYVIADPFVIPAKAQEYYAEKVVYLPNSFMASDDRRKISDRTMSRAEAGLPENGFVFCCFNNSYKITPDAFDIWMRLLGQVENSVLWMPIYDAAVLSNLRREAERRGVAAGRLIFAARTQSNEDHLARLRLADLFLDTFYSNAHSTASDALWAGIPLLTCAGEAFASRVAGSLLHAVGLPELVTHSAADYEALALKLARDRAWLASIRQRLACQREASPLFNTARFTRHIEAAYATMWERVQRGRPAESFAVAPI